MRPGQTTNAVPPPANAAGQDGVTTIAGIVVYHPDVDELKRLVAAVAPDVREVMIYANSPVAPEVEAALRPHAAPAALTVIRPGNNLGLGAAYNAMARIARERGDTFLFILDQDSLPEPGSIARLTRLDADLRRLGERPAVVGPTPIDPRGLPMKIEVIDPVIRQEIGAVRAAFIISSGSLIRCDALEPVGPFRDDFFIDAIDIEWCLRANARGFSVWFSTDARMDHRLGSGLIKLPFGMHLTQQPPRRLYTYIRNQLAMMRLGHVPVRYKVKTLGTMPIRLVAYLVYGRFSRAIRTAILYGLADGLTQRLGPPDRL